MILVDAPMFYLIILIISCWVPSPQSLGLLYKIVMLKLHSILAYCHFVGFCLFFFSEVSIIFDLNLGKKVPFPMKEDFKKQIIQKKYVV